MPSFNPHIGTPGYGYTSLPLSTVGTILDDIVTDVGAGVHGWTVYDDQRATTTYPVPVDAGGYNYPWGIVSNQSSSWYHVTSGSNVFWEECRSNTNFEFPLLHVQRSWVVGMPISFDNGVNWYNVASVTSSQYIASGTLDRVYTAATNNVRTTVVTRARGYIVLRCASAQKVFYVQLMNPPMPGYALYYRTWETWDNVTHAGTNSSPTEALRIYSDNQSLGDSTTLQYILWLLPDAIGLWVRGDTKLIIPGSTQADFMYVGNLTPVVPGDTDCLAQMGSSTAFSGIGTYAGPGANGGRTGSVVVLRSRTAGSTWRDPATLGTNSFPNVNCFSVWPKARCYLWNPGAPSLDSNARVDACDLELYGAQNPSTNYVQEMKRGDVKHLKVPVTNMGFMQFVQVGPADDGLTYVTVFASAPDMLGYYASISNLQWSQQDVDSLKFASAFSWANVNADNGGVTPNLGVGFNLRYFMLPTNL